MTLVEKIETFLAKRSIDIISRPAGSSTMSAVLGERCVIAIPADDMTSAEYVEYLGHEAGHCETGAFYHEESMFFRWEWCEYRATKWAIKKLLPRSKINAALRARYTDAYEIAEYVDLPQDFVEQAIFYHENGYVLLEH